ncbi:MAG: DUF309 domain-containing protein [Proteobacteria bacterium]|nr:DUF309 domain-containing protein [Pseudomonadota bacterium]
MNKGPFNPFEDRLSRDIRNEMSGGLAVAVETGDGEKLEVTMVKYRQQPLAECYRTYLEDRCRRYEKALTAISTGITDPIHRGLILWDLGLFFEVHEVLEHAWYTAQGAMKLTLQALIRAAGVYIKREYGYYDSAARIAEKAVPVLEENRELLAKYFQPEKLISVLAASEVPAPQLLNTDTRDTSRIFAMKKL